MTAFTMNPQGSRETTVSVTSEDVAVASVATLVNIPLKHSHVFVSVQQFDATPSLVLGSAGTYTVEFRSATNKQWFSFPDTSAIPADAPIDLDVAAPVDGVRVTPSGVAGDPVTYQVHIRAYQA